MSGIQLESTILFSKRKLWVKTPDSLGRPRNFNNIDGFQAPSYRIVFQTAIKIAFLAGHFVRFYQFVGSNGEASLKVCAFSLA
jgi:hypothetical protein